MLSARDRLSYCTAERCQELSQGYAVFAYPWKENEIDGRTPEGCEKSATPLQGAVLGLADIPARLRGVIVSY